MYTKKQQVAKKRIKPTQRQKGNISKIVREQVFERSGGICERCTCRYAKHMAHITSRKQIEHKTTSNDLLHLCIECHKWLDETPEGIRYKRRLKDESMALDHDEIP